MSDWWLEVAYLSYREPLPVFSSPGFPSPLRHFNNAEQKLDFAAKVIRGALDYKSLLDSQSIPVEMQGRSPLDMITYYRLFGVTRMPGLAVDRQTFHPNSNHIAVAYRNNVGVFDCWIATESGRRQSIS